MVMRYPVHRTEPVGPRRVSILGSTGSVGTSTLDLLSANPERWHFVALVGNRNIDLLARQARAFHPEVVVTADPALYSDLKMAVAGTGTEVAAGLDAVVDAASRPADWIMSSVVGAAGLAPTLAAVRQGTVVALANKESLVCAGRLVMSEVARCGATLLPVDSEHSAIFQALDQSVVDQVEKLTLTASGGPFRQFSLEQMCDVTPDEAVSHPVWSMGAKISVDSASMMNKGLELIEASHLFGVNEDCIDIVVHPQSVIHSMVSYKDGSILAQMGAPDMRIPIAFALGWPGRMEARTDRLDWHALGALTFEPPDENRFPALRLARLALCQGGGAPTVLNAANEIAVARFLDGSLRFTDIAAVVEETLARLSGCPEPEHLSDVLEVDHQARAIAVQMCQARLSGVASGSG